MQKTKKKHATLVSEITIPENTFDGMIFVSDAHPTEIKTL